MQKYLDALYLNHGYQFFAPDPEQRPPDPSTSLMDDRNTIVDQGEFPSKEDNWPRLLYHRYFMLADQCEVAADSEAEANRVARLLSQGLRPRTASQPPECHDGRAVDAQSPTTRSCPKTPFAFSRTSRCASTATSRSPIRRRTKMKPQSPSAGRTSSRRVGRFQATRFPAVLGTTTGAMTLPAAGREVCDERWRWISQLLRRRVGCLERVLVLARPTRPRSRPFASSPARCCSTRT